MADPKRGMRRNLTAYGDEEFSLFLRRAFIKAMGYTDEALDRPIIGITNTFSGFNACHRNVPELIDAVKRGELRILNCIPEVEPFEMFVIRPVAAARAVDLAVAELAASIGRPHTAVAAGLTV